MAALVNRLLFVFLFPGFCCRSQKFNDLFAALSQKKNVNCVIYLITFVCVFQFSDEFLKHFQLCDSLLERLIALNKQAQPGSQNRTLTTSCLLQGAKNHGVVMPDANKENTLNQLVGAAFGAAGQRCMALSTAVLVGEARNWLPELVERTKALRVNAGTAPQCTVFHLWLPPRPSLTRTFGSVMSGPPMSA